MIETACSDFLFLFLLSSYKKRPSFFKRMNVLDWDPDGFILGQDDFSLKIEITETSCLFLSTF